MIAIDTNVLVRLLTAADAMHVLTARATSAFFTFDKKMVKKAALLGLKQVSLI